MFKKGFTLIELLITLCLISLLLLIAYPSYRQHMLSVYRAEGKTALLLLAARIEEKFLNEPFYENITPQELIGSNYSSQKHYRLEIHVADAQFYEIQAKPVGAQSKDICGILTLDSTGAWKSEGVEKECVVRSV